MIENDAQLRVAVAKASTLLQDIHNYCATKGEKWGEVPEARVRFPRGFIRTAEQQRKRLGFVADSALKSNLAYTLMVSDTILWLMIRTDISGTAGEMLRKLYLFVIGALCESITKEYLFGICGKSYSQRTRYLCDQEIIDETLRADLDWLWERRNRMHLAGLDEREYENEYDARAHDRCIAAFRSLIRCLSETGRLPTPSHSKS